MRAGQVVGCAVAGALLLAGCSDDTEPGALVKTSARSTVGVVLDEIPRSSRDRAAESLLAAPKSFWSKRAKAQLRLTGYRLNFRTYFYEEPKGQLPMPPESVWKISTGEPKRQVVQGHDVVAVPYTYAGTLLSDPASTKKAEPKLGRAGGSWSEPFSLPLDSELLLQRTGFACMNESDYPFPSVDSEEVAHFYDQDADVEKSLEDAEVHFTVLPKKSCVDALEDHVGRVDVPLTFERLPWDSDMADKVRRGEVTGEEPDLEVYQPDFAESRVTYRYIHDGGCEVAEESVGGTGWRRLLQFATSDENVGEKSLVIGAVDYYNEGDAQPLDSRGLFEFSPCHEHFHFGYYGELSWKGSDTQNSKKAFCLQSTARVANRETSPLANDFGTCEFQGVAAGWLDEYRAGLPSQWLDTTDFPEGRGTRSFHSNPEGFLCEGNFVDRKGIALGSDEEPEWEATEFRTEDGHVVEKQRCDLAQSWDDNNLHSTDETIDPHGQGLITTPCDRGQIGPLRNCGFDLATPVAPCEAGESTTATFSVARNSAPQVVRLTDYSHALKSPIPARYEDSWVPLEPGLSDDPYMLANRIVLPTKSLDVTFTCPGPRKGGKDEPGGKYAVYTAPVLPGDEPAVVKLD